MRLVLLLPVLFSASKAAKVIAPWLSYCSPALLETSEFLSTLCQNHFWTYLESLADGKPSKEVIQTLLTLTEQELLDKALEYRLYAGRVKTHETLMPINPPECETFAVYRNETVCNPENLGRSIFTLHDANHSDETTYGHVLGDSGPTIILYSQIGSPSFLQFHKILKKSAMNGEIKYVYRHFVHHDCAELEPKTIKGFGLELEIKEYGQRSVMVETDHGTYLLEDPARQKNIEQVGLQLIQTILDSSKPLETLNFLSENAPMLLTHLSRVTPKPEIAQKAALLAQHFNLPETIISVNGAEVQSLHFDLQTVLEFLNEYQSLLARFLKDFPDKEMIGRQLMASSLQPTPIRFDVRSFATIFLNDLSRDSRYGQWPTTYRSLMRPPAGQFYPLARNVVVMTLIIDLDTFPMNLLEDVVRLVGQTIPIQVGLVVSAKDDGLSAAVYAINARLRDLDAEIDIEKVFEATSKELQFSSGFTVKDLVHITKAEQMATEAKSFSSRFFADEPMAYIWQREVMKIYQEEIYNLQMAVMGQNIDDTQDYLTILLDDDKTCRSRHSDIFATHPKYADKLPPWKEWIYSEKASDNCAFTVLVIVDSKRPTDVNMAKAWLEAVQKTDRKMRLKILPFGSVNKNVEILWKLNQREISIEEALGSLEQWLDDPITADNQKMQNEQSVQKWITENSVYLTDLYKLAQDGPVVTINGHIYSSFTTPVKSADIPTWLQVEWQSRAETLQLLRLNFELEHNPLALTKMTLFSGHLSNLMKQYSHLFTGGQVMDIPVDKVCHFEVENANALIQVKELKGLVDVIIIPNVHPSYTESPTKGVYRFRGFDGHLESLLPESKFSMVLNTPTAWDVDGASDSIDIDNLEFRLDNFQSPLLMMRGLVLEAMVHGSGRGLQGIPIELYRGNQFISRGVSMSLPGYTQLQSLPGIYSLKIPENGYLKMREPVKVTIDSLAFNGAAVDIEVAIGDESVLSRQNLPSMFYSKDEEKTVNVFTIVSGATYERLALIMIFSVIKNTTAPVKFWLISNFVTSRFRDALEKLSSRLKFEFELFRFHWPRWLNPQWRKHRRVWAHKILFLDAFPYNIKRLIYIDADQVMRGDVSQLAKIDLNGRVYGFVPFCDSRKESIPLQFWKSGYWQDYLRGLPYHISALFVIDMPRFRTESVGERLRAQYQPLSFDPASLANLDQDLPNNLQHEVPIHSLPSEWLWCETWCDEKSKGKAKSIDLCSNPLKKESKLEQAKRIIPEWKEYDQEIQAILAEGSSESDHDEL